MALGPVGARFKSQIKHGHLTIDESNGEPVQRGLP